MNIITLRGEFTTRKIWLNGERLSPAKSIRLRNHSPNGFNWGYGGSGPAQLALAILLRVTTKEKALQNYQPFKWMHISTLPQADFETEINIDNFFHSDTTDL